MTSRVRNATAVVFTTLFATLALLPGAPAHAQTPEEPIQVPRYWGLRPAPVPAGGLFRLMVIGRHKRDAASGDIAEYNAHVQRELSGDNAHPLIRRYGSRFRVLASTATVDARDNTGTNPAGGASVPIYWLNGRLIANNYIQLYTLDWHSVSSRRPDGKNFYNAQVHHALTHLEDHLATGSDRDGTAADNGHVLGASRVALGRLSKGRELNQGRSAAADNVRLQFYVLSPVFRALDSGVPYVTAVAITSDAGPDREYEAGDSIEATVTFSEAVAVTGTPVLELRLGGAGTRSILRHARYVREGSTATELVFAYRVVESDIDSDGVSLWGNALKLSGESRITKQGDDDVSANRRTQSLDDQAAHRVNPAPYVVDMEITSSPRADGRYGLGETIEATARFNEAVAVSRTAGVPELTLEVKTGSAGNDRTALYRRTAGSAVVFGYVVAAGDADGDGIGIKEHSLGTGGGTIRSAATGRSAGLRHDGASFRRHQVDAGRTPPVSSDATLGGLELTGTALSPAFDPATRAYTAVAANTVTSTSVVPTANDSSATAVVAEPADADISAGGHQVDLAVGETAITVRVTAGDTTTETQYTVTVTRLAAGALPEVTIAADAASVTEGTAATFTATRSGSATAALEVAVSFTREGEYIRTSDSYAAPDSVGFAAGSATGALTFATQADSTDEPGGTVTAVMQLGAFYTLGTASSATVAVEDDDAAPVATLVLTPDSISENGGESAVTATLDRPSSAETTLTVTVEPGALVRAEDFTLSGDTVLTIAAGATASTGAVTVTANDNASSSAAKNVTVASAAENAQGITAPDAVVLTITNDDDGPRAPGNLTATAASRSVALSWDPPGAEATVTSHEYRYRTASGSYPTWTSIADSGAGAENEDGVTVSGLTNTVTYAFEVRAVNGAGASEPSNEAGAMAGAGIGICSRTAQVRDAIMAKLSGVTDCGDVTAEHLSAVTGLLAVAGITALRSGDFDGLSSLTSIDLHDNQLTTLPAGAFSDLSSLTSLNLSGNRLNRLDQAMLSGLPSLQSLDLSSNELTALPDAVFSGLAALTDLDLSRNRFAGIQSGAFSGLSRLIELDLSHNRIQRLRGAPFTHLPALEVLRLASNSMAEIGAEAFTGPRALLRLYLNHNRIEAPTLRQAQPFGALESLLVLDIVWNPIAQDPTGMLVGLTSLQAFRIKTITHGEDDPRSIFWEAILKRAGARGLKLSMPAGAPYDVEIPIEIDNGSLDNGKTTLTVPTGTTLGEPVTVSRTPGTTGPVVARVTKAFFLENVSTETALPDHPDPFDPSLRAHDGYHILVRPSSNPDRVVMPAVVAPVEFVLTPAVIAEADDAATADTDESVVTVTATVERARSTAFTVEVGFAPAAPAVAGDYTLSANRTLTFAANATGSTGLVTLTAVSNDADAPDKTVTLSGTVSDAGLQAGVGAPAEVTLTIADDEGAPNAPTALTAAAGDGEVSLNWDAPPAVVRITRHEYRYRRAGAATFPDTWTAMADSGPGGENGSGYTVAGLTNGTDYTFQVRAVNGAGVSEPAAEAPAATPVPGVRLVVTPATLAERDDPGTATVDESAATVTATVSQGVATAFTVTVGFAPVAPAAAGDYTLSANRTLTFAANATESTGTVTLSAVDNEVGAKDKAVTVSGTVAGAPAGLGAPPAVTLTIADDDNRAPTAVDGRVETAADTAHVFGEADFGFADADDHALASVRVVTLPAAGEFTLGGAAVDAGDVVAAAALGNLTFTPAANGTGSPYTAFTFRVSDGIAESAAAYTMTVDVTALDELTASFEDMPADHDGEAAFTFRIAFSEPISTGLETIRDTAVEVAEGSVTAAQRVDGRSDLWSITVEPASDDAVSVSLPVPESCADPGTAVCTADGRALSAALTALVVGPPEEQAAAPLTATFEGVPSQYDPGDAFTFELRLSEDIEGLSFRTVREALWVRNGRVRRAQRLAKDSNQGWRVTVQPTRTGDITIVLPARACGESLAVCTADGRALSEQVVAEVRSTRFMAWLSASPREHDGETAFTLMLGLNVQPHGLSYRTVRDGLFDVSGGQVTGARRTRQDSSRLWLVTLAPASTADMSITVRGTESCEAEHAVCTEDGRRLRSGPSVTIAGPPGVTVADGRAAEGEDGTLDFTVSISRGASGPVTVAYATSDGTATAGQDYTAASGTLTFAAGELTKTVAVTVLEDAHDEDEETFTLTLSNVTGGAYLADATATGTITNSDPLQRAWLARFGRTVATHVTDAVGERLRAPPGRESHVTVGGYRQALGQTAAGGTGPQAEAPPLASLATGLLAVVVGRDVTRPGPGSTGTVPWADRQHEAAPLRAQPGVLQPPDLREVLLGSSFRLTLGADEGAGASRPRLTAWGRVAGTRFDGKDGELTLDGDVLTGSLGVDRAWDRWLAGVAVSHSLGEGSYAMAGTAAQGRGDLENTLTSLHPYLRYAVTERLEVWGVLGYGRGDLTLAQESGSPLETDTTMVMGAFGGRGILLAAAESGGFQLATRTDAMLTRTSSDAVTGETGNLASADAEAHRLRLVLEGSRGFGLSAGRNLAPSVEVGLRHDWGDAETGFGVELGGRVQYADPALGLTIEGAVRGLLAHEDGDYGEWGASGSLRIAPGPDGQGLAVTLAPAWGAASSGVDGLWSRQTTAGLAPQGTRAAPTGRLNAEASYGVAAPFGTGLLTPYAGTVLTDGAGRTYRLGIRWTSVSGLTLNLEGQRQEPAAAQPVNQGLQLQVGWNF